VTGCPSLRSAHIVVPVSHRWLLSWRT
jgi:hypothetical protein